MLGQGLIPETHHPAADLMGDAELSGFHNDIKMQVDRTVAQLPAHQTCVEQYCRAPDLAA
jgi:tryptophan halogenase